MPVAARLLATLADAIGTPAPRLGVAVSGGGDSMALLHLLADWRASGGPEIAAVTLDHGLRLAAAAEARAVALACEGLGVPHTTLRWQEGPRGNVMADARAARYGLIGAWAREAGIGAVALGHTLDDVAETFLMRLARGSGVDGLSAIADRRTAEGVVWLRPLLSASRADLRSFLAARGVGWVDDPTNDDPAYLRTRARAAVAALAPLGIGARTLAGTARRLARARTALEAATADLIARSASVHAGDVRIDRAALSAAPDDLALRLLAAAIDWVAPAEYRPRLDALERTLRAAREGRRATLGGALVLREAAFVRVVREPRAAALAAPATPGTLWDNRWRIEGGKGEVRALGAEGLAQLPRARALTGLPRASLLSSPALWSEGRLLAAPLAGLPGGVRLFPAREDAAFRPGFATH